MLKLVCGRTRCSPAAAGGRARRSSSPMATVARRALKSRGQMMAAAATCAGGPWTRSGAPAGSGCACCCHLGTCIQLLLARGTSTVNGMQLRSACMLVRVCQPDAGTTPQNAVNLTCSQEHAAAALPTSTAWGRQAGTRLTCMCAAGRPAQQTPRWRTAAACCAPRTAWPARPPACPTWSGAPPTSAWRATRRASKLLL